MQNGTTTHMADLGSCIVITKNVPCFICTQCGEVAYPLAVGERLEQIIVNQKDSLAEIAIVIYSDTAA